MGANQESYRDPTILDQLDLPAQWAPNSEPGTPDRSGDHLRVVVRRTRTRVPKKKECAHALLNALEKFDRIDMDGVMGDKRSELSWNGLSEAIQNKLGLRFSTGQLKRAIVVLQKALPDDEGDSDMDMTSLVSKVVNQVESVAEALAGGSNDMQVKQEDLAVLIANLQRLAASRLIVSPWSDNLSQSDLNDIERQSFNWIRELSDQGDALQNSDVAGVLREFLLCLQRYDESVNADFEMTASAGRMVMSLVGPASPLGVMAQHTMLLPLKGVLSLEVYTAEERRIAGEAEALQKTEATSAFMRRNHALPEEQRVPSPQRLASYALSAAASRILHAIAEESDEVGDPRQLFEEAATDLKRIRHLNQDTEYPLLPVAELELLLAGAKCLGEVEPLVLFARRTQPETVRSLCDLILEYEDSEAVRALLDEEACKILGLKGAKRRA